jgi:hypothetical protein
VVKRNWINGKRRKRNKTYAERFIDRAMNDGEERSPNQIVDAILTYIEANGLTFSYVPPKGKIIHYVNDAKRYRKVVNRKANTYVKLDLCNSCDGSGFISHKNCKDCNSESEEE